MNNFQVAGMVFGLIGFALVIWFGGWMLGLGLFLALFGNNLQQQGARP